MVYRLLSAIAVISGQLALVSCDGPRSIAIDCTPASHKDLRDRQSETLPLPPTGSFASDPPSLSRHVRTAVISAFDGMLYGYDYGEWGGELVYRPATGELVILAHGSPIVDMYRMSYGYFATSQRHGGYPDKGKVYSVTRTEGKIDAYVSHELEGPLNSSRLLREGGILLEVVASRPVTDAQGLERFVLREDGALFRVTCS